MYYVGVDVGGMSIKAGLVTEDGTIAAKKVLVIDPHSPSQIIVEQIGLLISGLVRENGLTLNEIGGCGLGFPGSVDSKKGVIRYCCNINLVNVKLTAMLKSQLGIRNIKISNDANCAALGETKFGVGQGCDNTLLITLGTGLGTGMVVDGKLFEGGQSAGAEGGHMPIVRGGDVCGCGERGHWEAYASATALIRQAQREADKHPESLLAEMTKDTPMTGKIPFDAAQAGDKVAARVIKKYLEYVSIGLCGMINVFRPELVIIGGGISNQGDYIVTPIRKYVNKHTYGRGYNPKIKVAIATLRNDAGIIGAASLAMA